MRIGVISDTHGLLRPEAMDLLQGVVHIVHAGDIGASEIIPRLRSIAPVTAVRGNIDTQEWALAYPEQAVVHLGGRTFRVLHDVNDLTIDPARSGADIVIAGHSHRPKAETIDGVLHLNPGSAGRRRFRLPVTLATIDLAGADIRAEIHVIRPPPA